MLLNDLSGFMFMIKLLQAMPKQKFDQTDPKTIEIDIDLMEKVYTNFQSASRYCLNTG